jgi:hypothetical protein
MGDARKRTGRRPVTEGKRSKFVNVRFTDAEVEVLARLEKELGMTRTDYIRLRALTNVEVVLVNSRELLAAIDLIGTELGHIGNNINQLARHANTLTLQGNLDGTIIQNFNGLFEHYLTRQRSLEMLLRKMMRTSGG